MVDGKGCDKAVFVLCRRSVRFSDEDICYVREGLDEDFYCFAFSCGVVDFFGSNAKAFHTTGDSHGKPSHIVGKILVCLELLDPFNGLDGYGDPAIVGNI